MAGAGVSCTGFVFHHCPPGPERDEALGLLRMAAPFREQQSGKKPEFLARYVERLVDQMDEPRTFARLLAELEFQAVRRATLGANASPVEKVDRGFELLTYWDPKRGRRQTGFGNLKKKLTGAKRRFP